MSKSHRTAFTLLEMVISVPLAAAIVLMALIAVRSIMETIRSLRTDTAINEALRSGWFTAMSEADYWNSYANPEYPWLKEYTSKHADPTNTDISADKRPFLPMQIGKLKGSGTNTMNLNEDITGLPPSDPRTWYRGGAAMNITTWSYYPTGLWVNKNDHANFASYIYFSLDPTISEREESNEFITVPAGWDTWHLQGDYASISNIDATKISTGDSRNIGRLQPNMMWDIFSSIGHIGVSDYFSAGTPAAISTDPSNRIKSNIGNKLKYWNIGEVPWSLNPTGERTETPQTADNGRSDNQRRNFFLGMPSPLHGNNILAIITSSGLESVPAYPGNFRSRSSGLTVTDYQTATSRKRRGSVQSNILLGMIIPAKVTESLTTPGEWNTSDHLDRVTLYPIRMLSPQEFLDNNGTMEDGKYGGDYRFRNTVAMRQLHTINTSLLPSGPSDAISNPNDRPHNIPSLNFSVFRYINQGDNKCLMNISAETPEAGRKISIDITTIGTTYRGARWLWGIRSSGKIGDTW